MRLVVTLANCGLQVTLAVGFFGKWMGPVADLHFSWNFPDDTTHMTAAKFN
jgi:hypothetical protein